VHVPLGTMQAVGAGFFVSPVFGGTMGSPPERFSLNPGRAGTFSAPHVTLDR